MTVFGKIEIKRSPEKDKICEQTCVGLETHSLMCPYTIDRQKKQGLRTYHQFDMPPTPKNRK